MSCFWLFRRPNSDLHRILLPVCGVSALRSLSSIPCLSPGLRQSYRLLQLPESGESSHTEVKEAYLRMAKLYHPDSGAPTADAALFSRIEEAYRAISAHLARQNSQLPQAMEEEDEEDKFKNKAPQHRHYLNFEGIGMGTPSQRERQYQQFRIDRANEQVQEYRRKELEKSAAEDKIAVAVRDRSKKIKITQAVERLVEDLIQESMARGDFRNLNGTGKPLDKFDSNPYADPMTHNLNRILIDNGYQPEWIVAQKEIRETIQEMRQNLKETRARMGNHMRRSEQLRWDKHCAAFSDQLAKLNKKVDDFNLIVPLMSRQMVHFSVNREVNKVLKADEERRKELEERENEKERQRKEEMERSASSQQNAKPGLIMWMQSLLK